jgi:3-oxoacyl-[acyl-carrier protein] reductase
MISTNKKNKNCRPFDFKDKTVLVTGGSRGIGAATVELFARLGARVAFNYQSNSLAADKVLRKIRKYSPASFGQRCDVADYEQVKQFVGLACKKLKHIDILVNNAGIWEGGAIDQLSCQDWQRTMQINLDSVFYFTKLVVARMKKDRRPGDVIFIASTAGQRGEAYHSHYAATKGALISLTKSLAVELAPFKIKVNCVAPGWVDTDMSADALRLRREAKKILATIPQGRIPSAGEIAGPIVFLASPWASAITGEILNVNAGSVLCG